MVKIVLYSVFMGLLGNLLGKKETEEPSASTEQKNAAPEPVGRYSESCSLCGNPGTDKKWAGQYWHVKCMRKAKKVAKGML